jgi:hypothetical protein
VVQGVLKPQARRPAVSGKNVCRAGCSGQSVELTDGYAFQRAVFDIRTPMSF